MIIAPSLDKSEMFPRYMRLSFVVMAAAFILAMGGYLCFFSRSEIKSDLKPTSPSITHKSPWNAEAIGSGPLSLHPYSFPPFIAKLHEELTLLGKNSRPGTKEQCTIGLKSSEEQRMAQKGEVIFIASPKGAAWGFSAQPTSCAIKPLFNEDGQVVLEVAHQKDGAVEKASFVLEESADLELPQEVEILFQDLQEAKLWGTDLLLQIYGGEEEKALSSKLKIEFPSSVCFVSQGDYLSWDGRVWNVISLEEANPDAPLAHIKTIRGKELEIEAWDETGFHRLDLKLAQQTRAPASRKLESFLLSPRLRNASQVSCMMGKRRAVLKAGDWLMRTPSGWRKLRTAKEVEACIRHELRGELFVFDSLEKEQGEMVLKGKLFDDMRSQFQALSIPVSQEKKERINKKP